MLAPGPGIPGSSVTQSTPPAAGPISETTLPPTDKTGIPPSPVYPAAAAPSRISYPAADLDVVVHPFEPSSSEMESRTLVPPETLDGYWLTLYGTPGAGSANTTYILGHSWEDRDAPFNHLSSAARPGDRFTAITASGTMTYTVDSVTTYLKGSLKDSPIWAVVPNRIVLISCYTEDPQGKNVVVVASPLRGP
ncbi:class F sortase [Arthrobacter cavernae]|nr:class F sortase [Arthrobacter cavernae]